MVYGKTIPRIDNILWLKSLCRPFPISAGEILDVAKTWHFSNNTIEFLRLFPSDEEFESEEDFVTRCEEVDMLIHEEQDMPQEYALSSQD